MYGLLLKALRAYVEDVFEDDLWSRVAISANCEGYDFNEIKSYAEELFQDCARAISEETSVPFDEVMFNIGSFFVCFLLRSRYSKMLKVLGRNLGEFFSELDNLHRHMHFKFPEMVAPFFTCASEYASGLTLQYGSTRKGYVHYTRGIITGIAKMFDQPVDVEVVHQTEMSAIFRLHYKGKVASALDDRFRLPATVFFEIFPFSILLDRILNIKTAGMGVLRVDPTIIKKQFSDCFAISSPFIELTWENILSHSNTVFDVFHKAPTERKSTDSGTLSGDFLDKANRLALNLRGQMKYLRDWDCIAYLASPRLRDVSDMIAVGLSLEDLSLHDSSRHRVLIGEQQSAELKLALREEQAKTKELEAITQRAEEETKRAENLLYRMLPQKIAMGLRKGIRPVGMSEHFENVTILFTDIVAFTVICSKLEPIEVVSMLSDLFAKFDELTTKYGVYKVETIGDAYMIASGCPEPTKLHAAFVAEVSFALKETTEQTLNPTASPPENLKIRIGIHSGPVMAGVVGLKMPRYCLFGETVSIANTLETNGGPNRINLSETTYRELNKFNTYLFKPHDEVQTPSKQTLNTYWLEDRCPEDASPRVELTQMLTAERLVLADCNLTRNRELDSDGFEGLLTARTSSAFSQSRRSSAGTSGF